MRIIKRGEGLTADEADYMELPGTLFEGCETTHLEGELV